MNSQTKILLIDKAPDRKERINALKSRGYTVFPARNREEARSRCMGGGYDLIVVNAGGEYEPTSQFCDDVRRQCPKQLLILCSDEQPAREYAVASDVPVLVQAVESLLGKAGSADFAKAA